MANRKYAFMMLLASFALTLGACNTKSEPAPSSSEPTLSSEPTSSSEPYSPSSSSSEDVKTVSSISIKEGTTLKTNYFVGDTFSVTGGRVVVNYSDHTKAEIDLTLAMITNPPDMSVPHENYQVNVTYEGKSASYIIQVIQEDTRAEVTIGVAYDYNGSEPADMENDKVFYEGRSYHFYYGTDPSRAYESVTFKYRRLGEDPADLGTEKPTAVGEYSYTAMIEEGDENYKPTSITFTYSIAEPIQQEFLLNKTNKPTDLTSELSDTTQNVEGLTINYKNAKAADENHVATLVKQSERYVNPDKDDNYLEIASPVKVVNGITLRFDDSNVNNYVCVFGSYDGTNYHLVDTLTTARQTTNRLDNYYYFRFVAAARSESKDINIVDLAFTYEVDGAPVSAVARAEDSDLTNTVYSSEEGAFYRRNEHYDDNYSSKSIGERLQETTPHFNFGFEIPARETPFYGFQFRYKPYNVDHYEHKHSGGNITEETTLKVYAKLTYHGVSVGSHKNIATVNVTGDWTLFTLESDFANYFLGDELTMVDGINIWIDSKVIGVNDEFGCILFDDLRVVQNEVYPLNYSLESIALSGMTTEYTKGDTFTFDGVITATYRNGGTDVITNDNPGVSISSPDMSTSGKKTITVSYTEDEITKKATYSIDVAASGDPKEEEILPIVAEENDLAKAANQAASGSSYDKGVIENETTVTYGNSTNSVKISKLYSTCVSYHDTGVHASIHAASVITKDTVHVKFFAKNLDIRLDLELCDDTTPKAGSVAKAAFAALTATDAGNGWVMYEYDFPTSGKNVYLLKFKCADNSGEHSDFFYIDGLEIY